jgi:hypothetical protein
MCSLWLKNEFNEKRKVGRKTGFNHRERKVRKEDFSMCSMWLKRRFSRRERKGRKGGDEKVPKL